MSQHARAHVVALLRVGSNPSSEIHGSRGSLSSRSTTAAAAPFFPHPDLVGSGGFHGGWSGQRSRQRAEGRGIGGGRSSHTPSAAGVYYCTQGYYRFFLGLLCVSCF
uniref:Uncharacterized protein n=1 Tax=Arundo donax TaxID=35708 RepID=A0A0A8XWE4_ARUDO